MNIIKTLSLIIVFTLSVVTVSFAAGNVLTSKAITGVIPSSPADKVWDTTAPVEMDLLPQIVAVPSIGTATISKARVWSVNNGTEIAFKLEWFDSTRDEALNMPDKYSDACAIQFPLKDSDKPNLAMGEKDKPVYIVHWKAAWEKDTAMGYQDVEHAYPNYNVDGYPLVKTVENKAVYPVNSFSDEAKAFIAGIAAKNPVSNTDRRVPVEELNAEGFGTLTSQSSQDANGKGIWDYAYWKVVITRKLLTDDAADTVLSKGRTSIISFAVWDGSKGNIGARKNIYEGEWLNLNVE